MCFFLANHGYVERDERAVAIRKLIEDGFACLEKNKDRDKKLAQIGLMIAKDGKLKPITKNLKEEGVEAEE